MATQFPDANSGMVARIKALLLTPKEEWPRIDATPMTVAGIYTGWVVPLAAIGPAARLIGEQVFGYGAFGVSFKPSLMMSLTTAVTSYVLALVAVYVLALVIDALAPNFGAAKNPIGAMKVAAFSATAGWLAGIFALIPMLGILGIVGLYSLYLLWIGLPVVMKPLADKATGYFAVVLIAFVVAFIVIGAVAGAVTGAFAGPAYLAGASGGSMTIGGTTIDSGKINAAAAKLEAASQQIQADAKSGKSSAVPAADLQAMLPASVAGFARGDVSSESGAAAGIGGSKAEGHYTQGDQSFTLSVSDMGAMGAIATLGGAVNAESSKTTATGYEKTAMKDGAMVSEKWDNSAHSGSYSTVVASRFAVEAEGNAPSIDALKAAVASVDAGKLAGMAK